MYVVPLGNKFTVHIVWVLPWIKRDLGRPRRRWKEEDHLKANKLHSTGLNSSEPPAFMIMALVMVMTFPVLYVLL
jgi:hypothetical protein